jgi:hypothetical protein
MDYVSLSVWSGGCDFGRICIMSDFCWSRFSLIFCYSSASNWSLWAVSVVTLCLMFPGNCGDVLAYCYSLLKLSGFSCCLTMVPLLLCNDICVICSVNLKDYGCCHMPYSTLSPFQYFCSVNVCWMTGVVHFITPDLVLIYCSGASLALILDQLACAVLIHLIYGQ